MLTVELIWREKKKEKQVGEKMKRKKMCEPLMKIRPAYLRLVLPALAHILFKTYEEFRPPLFQIH